MMTGVESIARSSGVTPSQWDISIAPTDASVQTQKLSRCTSAALGGMSRASWTCSRR